MRGLPSGFEPVFQSRSPLGPSIRRALGRKRTLRMARQSRGWTQARAAAWLGVSQP